MPMGVDNDRWIDNLQYGLFNSNWPGPVAQLVASLTLEPEVQGLIPGPATYFNFFFQLIQVGQLSVTGESMYTKYLLTA